MNRKLMRMGPSSIVVSLPADWVKRFNLKDKEEVEVLEVGNHLQIGSNLKSQMKKAEIDISKYDYLLLRVLGILYKTGYVAFRIKYDEGRKKFRELDYDELNLIKRAVDSYSGIDLVGIENTKNGNYVVAEQKAQILPQEFDRTFNQAFLHLKLMASEIFSALKECDFSKSEKVIMIDNLINETTNFCIRILSEYGYKEYQKNIFVYSLIEKVEQIGDSCRDMYLHFAKDKEKKICVKPVLSIFSETLALLDLFYHTYLKFTVDKMNECATRAKEIMDHINELSGKRVEGIDFNTLFLLYDITSKIWDALEPLMAINHELLVEPAK